jgi:hypothetical protein
MKLTRRAAHIGAAVLFGCGEPGTPPPAIASPPEITSKGPGGEFTSRDLTFRLAELTRAADGSQEVTAIGMHRGQPVRFLAVLPPAWSEGRRIADRQLYTGSVTIRSLGSESDALVRALDAVYEAHLQPTTMVDAVEFAAISLKGDPSHLAGGDVRLKLFFEDDRQERYAELYLNIDTSKRQVELAEKDEYYRRPIVRALAQRAGE